MRAFMLALVCALSCGHDSVRGGPIYDVRACGAIGDGTNDDTAAIQKALDASGAASGTVLFPAGIYLSKPLTLRTRTTVDFAPGAILQASPVPSDYLKDGGDWLKAKSSGAFTPFISGTDLEDIVIEGPGIIDGHGEVWWPEAEKARRKVSGYTLPRPNLIGLSHVKNLLVRDLTLRNSPKFHLVPNDCEGVVISNVTILAPEHAANTDAIDPGSCKNVLITRCTIDVGDDNVAIKAGGKVKGRDFACEDIVVSDCTFRHGHGMSIGGGTGGGVRNLLVTRCTFDHTENGIRIKSTPTNGGLVEDIRYEHLSMTNVDPAITFTCYYQNNSAKDAPGAEPPASPPAPASHKGTPMYRDIYITDLTATCQRSAGLILGLPSCCVSNVVLADVSITAASGLKISNARGIELHNVSVKTAEGKAFILANARVDGLPAGQP